MKEQEVFCFTVDAAKEAQENPKFDVDTFITDEIKERIDVLNAQGKRVIEVSFPKGYYADSLMVCLLCEKA